MKVRYPELLDLRHVGRVQWTERDLMLYALAIGIGSDPVDPATLPFVFEKSLRAVPTFIGALSMMEGAWSQLGLDAPFVLHGAHATTLHKPIPLSAICKTHGRIVEAWDQGPGRAAIIVEEMTLVEESSGDTLATIRTTAFARRDGGFGGPVGRVTRNPMPDRAPDHSSAYATLPQQALLYRLTGDYNPLHADPDLSKSAGFDVPILHGMCSYGMTCRAVLDAWCDNDPRRILHHEARFTAPITPGETLIVDMWEADEGIRFRARSKDRDVIAIDDGLSRLGWLG